MVETKQLTASEVMENFYVTKNQLYDWRKKRMKALEKGNQADADQWPSFFKVGKKVIYDDFEDWAKRKGIRPKSQ